MVEIGIRFQIGIGQSNNKIILFFQELASIYSYVIEIGTPTIGTFQKYQLYLKYMRGFYFRTFLHILHTSKSSIFFFTKKLTFMIFLLRFTALISHTLNSPNSLIIASHCRLLNFDGIFTACDDTVRLNMIKFSKIFHIFECHAVSLV